MGGSASPGGQVMIEVRDLTKRYGATLAVDGLTFTVRPGVVTGFLGPNGAGKTTTMRLILGLDHPVRGDAKVGGRRYRDLPAPLREVGVLLDGSTAHPGRRARCHLECLARSNHIQARRVDEVLALTGLQAVGGRRAGGFSLGMRQRLGIAAALLGDPPVLMLDEPVNGLDPEGIVWVRQLLRGLAAEGRTVLVSSHLMSEMALTADHLIVIGQGRLLRDASVREFTESFAAQTITVRSPQLEQLAARLTAAGAQVRPGPDESIEVTGLDAAAVGDLAAKAELTVHELVSRRASLEEAFMELTRDSTDYRSPETAA
jgi:ABC-2 type transport system ATP-binding protein